MGIHSLTDVGTDAGAGADQLVGQHRFPLGSFDFIAYFDDFQGKGFGFIQKRTGHGISP